MLYKDRRAHARTILLMEREATMSQEAWGRSMDASDLARSKVMSLRTTILGQQAVITELQAADYRRQAAITELLAADRRRQAQFIEALKLLKALQTHMTAFQRQQGPAKGPAQPDAPVKAENGTKKSHQINIGCNSRRHIYHKCPASGNDQGITAALAARDANRSTNGDDSYVLRTGTEGVVELIQWLEKMETIFSISNCSVENQIKFSTCTLLAGTLTWWNSHVRTVGHDVTYAITWTDLKKMMTNKYCPRVEIKKLEAELWNLKVKEFDKIKRYVDGLPDMIYGSVVASKPKTIEQEKAR
ncbi:reverse transcriptase domain-containing protein [Tanacetum coccineum]